jgi:hypothetical protein
VIGIAYVIFESRFESRQCHFIEAEDKFLGGGSGEDFVEQDFEIRIGNSLQAEGWLAHFTDTLS